MLLSIEEEKSLSKTLAQSKAPLTQCEIIVSQLALKARIALSTDLRIHCLHVGGKCSVS